MLIYLMSWTKISQSLSLSLSVSVSQSQSHSLSFSVLVSQSQYLSPSFSVSAFQSQSLSLSFSDSGRKEVRKERRKENRLICLKKSTNQGQPLVFKNETVDISVEWANLSQLLLWQELKAWLSCSSEFTGMRGWIVSLKCKIRLALTATYYS